MNKLERFFYGFLILIGLFTFLRYAQWWFRPEHIPANWLTKQYSFFSFLDFGLFAILSFVVFFGLILKIGTWFTTWFMKRPFHIPPQPNLKVAFLTCYVPGNEPISMLRETLLAMKNAHYEHDTWVLDEGNQDEVKQLSAQLGVKYFSRFNKDHYNQPTGPFRKKTKAGNLNSWRNEYESNYDIVAQVDMDHVPHKDYLTKLLGYFSDPEVGFVGVPQIYKNTENWIARGAAEQTHFFYGPLQQGFYGSHMPFLIGTTHIYRVAAMKSFGGYAPTIAEDYLTGMHFFSNGWKGVYVPEVLAQGLGPITWTDYFNQQMRWSYGLYEILFKHTHLHILRLGLKQKINLVLSQMFYFSGLATFLGFALTSAYLTLGINSTNMNLVEWSIYAIPAYLSGFFILLFLHKFYIDPKKEPNFAFLGMLLGQAASIIYTVAFFKFITKRKLTYVVTPKDINSVEKLSWKVFSFHILILLFTILTLTISFITSHDSVVMRFWAVTNVLFISLILLTAYWINLQNKAEKIYALYRFFEFNVDQPELLPSAPTNEEKYWYVTGDKYFFIVFSIISFTAITICTFNFVVNNPLMWPLIAYLLLTIIYFFVSLIVNVVAKGFSISRHKELIKKWKNFQESSIDIFLPTAGEDIEVLKNTWNGVDELITNYQGNITVYVLDDSDREEVRALTKIFGYRYEVRPDRGWYKKAGNLRHGFKVSNGEYIVIFDADFRPRLDFLNELLPYFYENKSIGLVQSPQFFDTDPNRNWLQRGAGAVQELFYRVNQISRQNYNASICVGSNAIYRRAALDTIGGTALIEHSEDVHTGFNLRMRGWIIQYVPIVLAKGLCPNDLNSFFKQQYRWCMGSMSLLTSKKFWDAKLSTRARLSYFSGFLYYIHTAISSFFTPIIPLIIILFYPNQVTLRNYLLIVPSIIFVQIVYPLWHRVSHGIESWSVRSVYSWAHLFAIFDVINGKAMSWQASGSKMKKDNRYITFRILQILLNFLPTTIWVYFSVEYVLVQNNLMFLPLMLGGIYYLLIVSKVTFYFKTPSPITLKKSFYNSLRLNPSIAFAVFSLFFLVISITFYQIKNPPISTEKNLTDAPHNQLTIIESLETPPLVTVEAISENESSASAKLTGVSNYTEKVVSGDSQYRVYRRIINSYLRNTNNDLTASERTGMENYLIENLPPQKLRNGNLVEISQTDLFLALSESKL